MRALLKSLFQPSPVRADADRLYNALVRQARSPAFYRDLGVPDTIDGRFDLVVLHAVIAFDALQTQGPDGARLAQVACDRLFKGFEGALREIGIGDLTIPKKVKAMAGAYQGRVAAYLAGLAAPDGPELADAIARNVYRGAAPAGAAEALARYARTLRGTLQTAPVATFAGGALPFPALPDLPPAAS